MSRARINAVLLAIVLVAGVVAGVLYVRGGESEAEAAASQYPAIAEAAEDLTTNFLTVDYKNMDALTAKVVDGSTGEFKKEYSDSLKELKDAAAQQESTAKGSVDAVGISEADADSATAFVSAGSTVKNTGTKGKTEQRSWRIKLSMVKEGDRWLVGKLEFVG